MRIRQVSATVLALVAVTACNGDDDATSTTALPSSTTEVVETTVPESTQPPTTAGTTAPPTTDRPDTTTSTIDATTPPTDPATTSIPNDGTTDMIAVVDVVELAWQASLDALRDPTDDELRERLGDYYTGTLLEGFQNLVDGYREQNFRTVENPDVPDSLDVALASIAVNEAGTFATVQACDVTSGILVEVGAMADGSDRVVDDRVGRVVIEFEVVRVGGDWKVENGRSPDASERIATCE